MIDQYFNNLERAVSSSPGVISYAIERMYGGRPNEGYIKGKVVFANFSKLEFSEFVEDQDERVRVIKYRYQYMEVTNQLIFRYDNAPHHRELETFPDHKHLNNGQIISAIDPNLNRVMREIVALLVRGEWQ